MHLRHEDRFLPDLQQGELKPLKQVLKPRSHKFSKINMADNATARVKLNDRCKAWGVTAD